jgi:hypothetical protein
MALNARTGLLAQHSTVAGIDSAAKLLNPRGWKLQLLGLLRWQWLRGRC